ncbi:MAG: Hsp20/alpha crystallin family protein [Thermoplasmata archaeon]|nr:Hsp20/alpha crystallin family protein [Thermoplasmata archaeon]
MFDDDKKRRKGMSDEEMEKMMREMQKIIEDVFRSAIEGFENAFSQGFPLRTSEPEDYEDDEIQQKDIIEDEKKIYVTIAIPDVEEDEIDIRADGDILEIIAGDKVMVIELPSKVKKKFKKAYRNGILDIELEKRLF